MNSDWGARVASVGFITGCARTHWRWPCSCAVAARSTATERPTEKQSPEYGHARARAHGTQLLLARRQEQELSPASEHYENTYSAMLEIRAWQLLSCAPLPRGRAPSASWARRPRAGMAVVLR
eukprot:scaffold18649_cov112-Isochrysis_galbana.AAC.3